MSIWWGGGGREKKTDVKVNVILLRNVVSFEEWTWASQDNTGGSNRKASSNLFLIKKILNCIQPASAIMLKKGIACLDSPILHFDQGKREKKTIIKIHNLQWY